MLGELFALLSAKCAFCRSTWHICTCPNIRSQITATLPMQFDIHSPATTVREALAYSAELRLADVQSAQLQGFINEVGHAFFCLLLYTSGDLEMWLPSLCTASILQNCSSEQLRPAMNVWTTYVYGGCPQLLKAAPQSVGSESIICDKISRVKGVNVHACLECEIVKVCAVAR